MKYMAYLKEHYVWAGLFGWLLFSIEVFLLTVCSFFCGYFSGVQAKKEVSGGNAGADGRA